MSIVRDMGKGRGVSLPCYSEAIKEGYVYKMYSTTDEMTICTAIGDLAYAIALSSSLDPQLGTAKVMTEGDNWGFALLNSKLIVTVASEASQTWEAGAIAYLSTTDGTVGTTYGGSAYRPIGHYFGPDHYTTSSTAGEFIEVYLDIPIGASLV